MKLETAYRKFFPFRIRWKIWIRFDSDDRPVVEFLPRNESGTLYDIFGEECRDVYGHGLARAMMSAVMEMEKWEEAAAAVKKAEDAIKKAEG